MSEDPLTPDEFREELKEYEQYSELIWDFEGDNGFGFTIDEQDMYKNVDALVVAFWGRHKCPDWIEYHETLDKLMVQLDYYYYYGNNLVTYVSKTPIDVKELTLASKPDTSEFVDGFSP